MELTITGDTPVLIAPDLPDVNDFVDVVPLAGNRFIVFVYPQDGDGVEIFVGSVQECEALRDRIMDALRTWGWK